MRQHILGFSLAAFVLLTPQIHAQGEDDSVAAAESAALSWLALTDAGDYARSWQEAAAKFQASISKIAWVNAAANARSPLGNLISRKVKSATFTRSLPGAPEGQYVVIRYESQFEHKANAIETVTPSLESNGSWRVSGYFIK